MRAVVASLWALPRTDVSKISTSDGSQIDLPADDEVFREGFEEQMSEYEKIHKDKAKICNKWPEKGSQEQKKL
jgi:hypothetical protein